MLPIEAARLGATETKSYPFKKKGPVCPHGGLRRDAGYQIRRQGNLKTIFVEPNGVWTQEWNSEAYDDLTCYVDEVWKAFVEEDGCR